MFFLQDSTPDTSSYMIAGYVIAFTIIAIYLISLAIRWRNLDQDLQTLENIQMESQPKVDKPKISKPKTSAKKKGRKGFSTRKKK